MVHRECVGTRETARTRRLDTGRHDAEELKSSKSESSWSRPGKGSRKSSREFGGWHRSGPTSQLELFLRQARMHSRRVMDQLRHSWAAEGDERTAFGLFNALTRLATHGNELSARQRVMLARLAGIYANRHVHLCPNCFSIMAWPGYAERSFEHSKGTGVAGGLVRRDSSGRRPRPGVHGAAPLRTCEPLHSV